VSDFFNHPSGRFATFKLSLDNRDLLICPVYAPAKRPSERSEFFKLLNAHISSVLKPSEELILLGDFNCVESPDLDRLMPASRMDPSAFEMLRLAASLDVSDAFRHIFPEKREYSFVSNLGRPARLDRVYVSSSLLNSVVNVDHPPNAYSDHTFLQVDLDLQPIAQGKNSWNLPSALLEDTV